MLFAALLCIAVLGCNALESEKILGGQLAPYGSYNYYVSLQRSDGHFCGGAILDDYHVLTAAHCVVDTDSQQFVHDTINVARRNSPWNAEVLGQVEKIFVSRGYTRGVDDIAVLKLSDSLRVDQNPQLGRINLPYGASNYQDVTAEAPGSGFDEVSDCYDSQGNIGPCFNQNDHRLKVLHTQIVSNADCQMNVPSVAIRNYHICAKPQQDYYSKAEGLCSGDSGGPLVIDNTVVGIVSLGPSTCDESVMPSVFTRVSSYLPFINSVTGGYPDHSIRVGQLNHYYPGYTDSY